MTKEERKKFKEVEKAFNKIMYTFEGVRHGTYGKELFNINYQEEKKHHHGIKHGLSITQGAKFFTVKRLIEAFDFQCTIKDVLTSQKGWIQACTLFSNYPDEVKQAFEGINIKEILSLEYVNMMKID